MKQYEAYKDSGVQWLGEIPNHWEVCRVKSLFDHISGNGFKIIYQGKESGKYPFCKASDINGNNMFISSAKNYVDDDIVNSEGYNVIPEYSILFSKIGEALKKNHRKINTIPCIVDNNCSALVNHSSDNIIFLYYVMNVIDMAWFDNAGVIPCVNVSKLMNCGLPLPPLVEQEVIAAYLDERVGKIDAIITEKEAMVDQLQQYRKSLISETVTRGLNPIVPMKDSGIDWIGQIPAHWVMVKLKYISNLQSGSNLTSEQIEETGEYPVFGGNGLRGYYHDFNTEGDRVLIGRQGALCGNINYASGKFWATEHAVVCHPIKQYNVIWLGSLLEIMNLNQYSIASAQPGLSVDRIKQLEIPLPPFDEQQEIGSFIEKKDLDIRQSISELQSQIEDLKAYKSSVIAEAVTGKVDLRDWKPSEDSA